MTKEELENYVPKGELEGFPKEVIARMLDYQEEQGNKRDVNVFEKYNSYSLGAGGFDWAITKEEDDFWYKVILKKDFDLFFEKYPKKEDNQVFRVGDKVYDIMLREIGIVTKIILNDVSAFPIEVYYEDCGRVLYALEGRFLSRDKYPRLLHYRDDYDYSVIDFNNLPKRQEQKMWRAKDEGVYHFVNFLTKGLFFSDETKDDYVSFDNDNYNSGNYFRTEVEAEIIAQKLNSYFKQLIQEEHDIHRN
jgi:hypothetical protein